MVTCAPATPPPGRCGRRCPDAGGSGRPATRDYYRRYVGQLRACTDPNGQLVATVVPSALGLIDRPPLSRQLDWTEVAAVDGSRATFLILTDPGHRITRGQAKRILRAIRR